MNVLPENEIICGDCLAVLKTLPSESVNCCISSPPYWALRDYGTATWEGGDLKCAHDAAKQKSRYDYSLATSKIQDGSRTGTDAPKWKDICPACGAKKVDRQLGLEPTIVEYIEKLCGIYDEVKRVLRKDGTCFVNLGDTYNGSGGDHKAHHKNDASFQTGIIHGCLPTKAQLPVKSLCLIPQQFAIEMVNRGWILRNTLIWHKPNPMPSSAKDRFTVDFEYVYFFVKSKKYWFEPLYEPCLTKSNAERPRMGQGNQTKYNQKRGYGGGGTSFQGHSGNQKADGTPIGNPLGRNKRCVWTIPTEARSEAHFATFPQKLIEPMIKAGCPRYICKKCGKPRVKIYKTSYHKNRPSAGNDPRSRAEDKFAQANKTSGWQGNNLIADRYSKGYSDCGCGAGFRPGIVLDEFMGSGTVARVAAKLDRNYIGIELNPEYIEKIAKPFVAEVETGVTRAEQETGQLALFESKI